MARGGGTMMCEARKIVFTVIVSFLILTVFASVSEAKTIYVPDDYAKIQWAIDNASAGDTIIVRDGTYVENVDVDKSLTIISENGSANCIVDAGGSGSAFTLNADGIKIEGFTVRNAGALWNAGIKVCSNNNCITGNKILNNSYGILLIYSNNNSIVNNKILNNALYYPGILLHYSNNNRITGNNISLNGGGITLDYSNNNCIRDNKILNNYGIGIASFTPSDNNIITGNGILNNGDCGIILVSDNSIITDNKILNNCDGIHLIHSSNNSITGNNISLNSHYGILLYYSGSNKIYLNNFINNNVANAAYYPYSNVWNSIEEIIYTYNGNTYKNYLGNYWSDYTGSDADGDGIGDTPYSIRSDADDADNYPLMQPFENYFQPTSTLKPKPKVTISYEWHDGYINLTIQLRNEGEGSNFGGVHIRLENATFVSVDKGTFDSVTAYDIIDPEAVDRDPANHTMKIEEKPNVIELYVKGDSAQATARIKPGAGDGLKIYYRAWLKDKDDTVYNPYTGKYEAYVARDPVEEPGDPRSRNPPYSRHVGDDGFSFIDYKCHDIRIGNVKILPVPYEYQDGAQWCALASAAILLRYYGYDVHLWDIARDLNLAKTEGVTLKEIESYLKEKYNLKTDLTTIWFPSKKSVIKRLINEGKPVIFSISNESKSKSGYEERKFGHGVIVVGYMESEDDFYIYM